MPCPKKTNEYIKIQRDQNLLYTKTENVVVVVKPSSTIFKTIRLKLELFF